jgi:hypothetical protein
MSFCRQPTASTNTLVISITSTRWRIPSGTPILPNGRAQLARAVGPRNLIHSWATDVDDPTVEPRWGKVGKQKIVDEGPLPPNPIEGIKYNMQTFDEAGKNGTL